MGPRLARVVATGSSAALSLLLAGGAGLGRSSARAADGSPAASRGVPHAGPRSGPHAFPAPPRGSPFPTPRRFYPHPVPRSFIPPTVVPFVAFGFYYYPQYDAAPSTYQSYGYTEYEDVNPQYAPPPDLPTPPPDPFYEEVPPPDLPAPDDGTQ